MDYEYVVLKLMNGETIIGILVESDDSNFYVLKPLLMSSVKIKMKDDSMKEVHKAVEWCPYAENSVFPIYKNDVILIAPLNEQTINYYNNLVDIDEEELVALSSPEDEEQLEHVTVH